MSLTADEAVKARAESPRSEREAKRLIYAAIAEAAALGDVIFTVTTGHRFNFYHRVWRSWLGHMADDSSKWHTTVYAGTRKERHGAMHRPYVIHSAEHGLQCCGTSEEHIPPGWFSSRGTLHTTLEVLQLRNLDAERRNRIVKYARARVGTPHDKRGWERDILTYLFGLPVIRQPNTVSCHALAYEAYASAGVSFGHRVDTMPWFNPAKWTGRPFGQPRAAVDTSFVYLRDHHLYDDERFRVVLSVSRHDGQITIRRNPQKYSWLASTLAA